jgi:hypothetical protein
MPGHAKVLVRPPSILITDVAFAYITRHDEDFFGRPKNSCPAPCHTILPTCPEVRRAEYLDTGIARLAMGAPGGA